MSAAAVVAHQQGFAVTGCDQNATSPYLSLVKKLKIPVYHF